MALSVARQCSAIGRSASVKHLFKPSNAGRVPRLRLSAPTRNVEVKATEDKKILKREEEPEEYWTTKAERKGANPLSDPLAIIGLLAILSPFAILLIAIATGLVDVSVYR